MSVEWSRETSVDINRYIARVLQLTFRGVKNWRSIQHLNALSILGLENFTTMVREHLFSNKVISIYLQEVDMLAFCGCTEAHSIRMVRNCRYNRHLKIKVDSLSI